MKKTIKMLSLFAGIGFIMPSCSNSSVSDYQKTETGLYYKFEVENKTAPTAKVGDIIVTEIEVKIEDSIIQPNTGQQMRIMVDNPLFAGDLFEALTMVHTGDKVSFAISIDSMVTHKIAPPEFAKKENTRIFYNLTIHSIISKEEIDKEKAAFEASTAVAKESEKDSITAYVTKNNIKVQPTANGLYIIFIKKGTGIKVEDGKKVKVNYTGHLLNGKVFDTSLEQDAKEAGIYNSQRPYQPLEYIHKQQSMIKGWDEVVSLMRVGDVVEVVMPSSMGYGEYGSGRTIPPYSPLVFKMELVSVE